MTVLTWIMGVVGAALVVASYAMLCLRVDRLTHHVNRLIESEDRRRGNYVSAAIRREMRRAEQRGRS